ncbi:MAG: tail fiber domain-containing protein [Bacteroidia bacterium]
MKFITKLLVLTLCLFSFSGYAQAPEGFNYQAVARTTDGDLMKNKSITVKAVILTGSSASSIAYEETHVVTTSDYGHFNIVIGEGSSSDDFSTLDWGSKAHHLKIEIDQGSGYAVMGTIQLQSVPYALHSKTAETANSITNLDLSTADLSDVNSEGVATGNVLKWDGSSWAPSSDVSAGTGIGIDNGEISAKNDYSIWNANKLQGQPLSFDVPTLGQVIKWDGTEWKPQDDEDTQLGEGHGIILDDGKIVALGDSAYWNANKISGYPVNIDNPILDQILVWDGTEWVSQDQKELVARNGLTMTGDTIDANADIAMWNASKLNGIALTTGAPNTNQVLQYDGTNWNYTTLSGGGGGSSIWTASGSDIYYTSATGNVGINISSPNSRLHVRDSLTSSTAGTTILADHYLYGGTGTAARYEASRNVVIGQGGFSNVAALNAVGGSSTASTGENIGTWSQSLGPGGYNLGAWNQTNDGATSQSIGTFSTVKATSTFNFGVYAISNRTNTSTNVGVYAVGDSATTSYAGYFVGDVNYTGTLTNVSDRKLKYDISSLNNATSLLKRLEPKSYYYKQDGEAGYLNLSEGLQFGFVAQELEEVLPNLVKEQVQPKKFKSDEKITYKAVNYTGLIPVLTQALKEQQELIEQLEKRISDLEAKQ